MFVRFSGMGERGREGGRVKFSIHTLKFIAQLHSLTQTVTNRERELGEKGMDQKRELVSFRS